MAELPNAEDAFDVAKQDAVVEAMKNMSPEQRDLFLFLMKAKYQKRKLQLTGYLVGLLLWLAGMIFALVIFGTSSGFVGWVFLLPFAAVGLTLWIFGKWAERVGNKPPPPDLVAAAKGQQK